jgi:uncharacterized phage-like protein YoqJ
MKTVKALMAATLAIIAVLVAALFSVEITEAVATALPATAAITFRHIVGVIVITAAAAVVWVDTQRDTRFPRYPRIGEAAGANSSLVEGKDPQMRIRSKLADMARNMATVIAILLTVLCLTATPGATPLVASPTATAAAAAAADSKKAEAKAKGISQLEAAFAGLKLGLKALRLANRNNWSPVRLQRYCVSRGLKPRVKKPAPKAVAKPVAKPTAKPVAKAPAKAPAKPAPAAVVEANPFTTCTSCNVDRFTNGKEVEAPFVCAECESQDKYWEAVAKAEEVFEARNVDADEVESQWYQCTGVLAFAGTTTTKHLVEALMGQTMAEFLSGGPGFLLIALVVVVGGLALLSWASQEEKKDNEKDAGDFRLYSGPVIRHTTTGQWTAVEADKAETAETIMGQEAEKTNQTEESPSVAQGESPKEEGMNAFINASNQMLARIVEAVRSGAVRKEAKADPRLDTYGGYLHRAHVRETILTILAGEEVRETEIFTLTGKSMNSDETLDMPEHWLDKTGYVLVLRGGQVFRFREDHFRELLTHLQVAPQAVGKLVSLEEVDKYLGTVLWAKACVTKHSFTEAAVMSKDVAGYYDGTNYASDRLASGIVTSDESWVGYAIRRLLTASGLFKGMIIVLHEALLPPGTRFLGSEVKPHLTLRKDKGLAIAAQPQGDAHSGEAGTASLQMWMALMGKFVAGRRFANFVRGSYAGMIAKLPETLGKNSRPVSDEVDSRDMLLREAARLHGFSAVAVFRTAAKALAETLSKGFDPFTLNVVPQTKEGKSLMVTGYPLMLPWLALADAWLQAGLPVPAHIQAKLDRMEEVRNKLIALAGKGVLPILVENWDKMSFAEKAEVLHAVATRIPTGKTSGVKVLLIDATPYADLIPEIVGSKKEVRFWLFPCEETNRFKELSEGGDDDDVYYFLLEELAEIAEEGISERERLLVLTEDDKKDMKALAEAIANRAKKHYHAEVDEAGEAVWKRGAAYGEAVKAVDAMMALPEAKQWAKMMPNSHFKFSSKKEQWYVIAPKLAVERIIRMTDAERETISSQTDVFVRALMAGNDSPFTAAIGTVAQGHKFAFGILGGIIQLPPELQRFARAWALLIVGTILLSDMVDAANKGKGFKKADEALKLLNLLWWWLAMYMAKNPNARIVAPKQFLKAVPPHAKKLFEGCVVQPAAGQPGHLLAEPYELFKKLGDEVEAATREEFDRKEWAETQMLLAEDAAEKVTDESAAQIAARVWKTEWRDSGASKAYTEALKAHGEAIRAGHYRDIREEQAAMEVIREILLSTHARFDAVVVGLLLEAKIENIELAFKKVKLALVYNEGFKYLDSPENAIVISVNELGNEFDAVGGVPSSVLVTSGESKQGPFVGGSEVLVEWMTAVSTLERLAEKKSKVGLNKVVISVKSDGFKPKDEDGKRSLLLSESDFAGKTLLEALSVAGASLAGSGKEEAHPTQDRWIAALADDLAVKREALRKRFMQKGKDNAELKELLSQNTTELLERCGLSNKLAAAVVGTVKGATIETYDWLDAKRQAHASYANTFIVLTFGETEGKKDEPVIPEPAVKTVTEPALVVVRKRNSAEEIKAKLDQVAAPALDEEPWYTDAEVEEMGIRQLAKAEEAPAAPAVVATTPPLGRYRLSTQETWIDPELTGVKKATIAFHEVGHMAHDLTKPSLPMEGGRVLVQEKVANYVALALMGNSDVAHMKAEAKAIMTARFEEISGFGTYITTNLEKAGDLAREIIAKLNADDKIVARLAAELAKYGYKLGGNNGDGGNKSEASESANSNNDYAISGHKYQEACHENGEYSQALAQEIMTVGTNLRLAREADNAKDSNAVAMHLWEDECPSVRLGYLPKTLAKSIATLMDASDSKIIIAIITGWDSGYPRFILGMETLYQGRRTQEDGRHFQYWTANKAEAGDYGQYVDTAVISTLGSGILQARLCPDELQYQKTQYQIVSGYWFDLLDGQIEQHNAFFAHLEYNGYSGISWLGGEDSQYFVTFGNSRIISRESGGGPEDNGGNKGPVKVAFTGHRPQKIGGFDTNAPKRQWVRQQIRQQLAKLLAESEGGLHVITGGALGVDQDAAMIAKELGIPYEVMVPCKGQDTMWPDAAKRQYAEVLKNATSVTYVSEKTYNEDKGCMNRRNEKMINAADLLIAVYDGSEGGGTAHACNYAGWLGANIIFINPNNYK